ncbi:hypothetical protein UPYG_G00161000 [Umbra pygmaea]|uniref:Interferon-induced protein 44-like n=1 Tax=Umbra pygmaea TaxID=75934 RepID=A0ABD0X9H3_UMBPY
MGNSQSTPPPPEEAEFDKAWREISWSKNDKDTMVDELKNIKLFDPEVGQLRCLLLGQVGAGKSSFINSVKNVFEGRNVHGALVAAGCGTTFTKIYKTHYIRNGTSRLPFAFNDVMGLEAGDGHGAHPDDIINALKGHLPEGFKFNPSSALTDESEEYNKNPSLSDKVHCLVYVIPADKVSIMSQDVINKMKSIRDKASQLEIPQVIVMTMPDKACNLVGRDLKKMYTSKAIKQKMQMCSNELGIPMNCILPVKNYHEETHLDNDMDILILNALTQIMNYANDYLWNLQQK